VAELRPHLQEIRDSGGDLVVVGTGDPRYARAFQEEMGIDDVRVYSDAGRRAYDLAGFRRRISALLSPRAIWNYICAFLTGHKYKGVQGDALQQGGVLVVRPDGRIVFRFASRASGDHPKPSDVVAAVRAGATKTP
jgi:hypothetical protein